MEEFFLCFGWIFQLIEEGEGAGEKDMILDLGDKVLVMVEGIDMVAFVFCLMFL